MMLSDTGSEIRANLYDWKFTVTNGAGNTSTKALLLSDNPGNFFVSYNPDREATGVTSPDSKITFRGKQYTYAITGDYRIALLLDENMYLVVWCYNAPFPFADAPYSIMKSDYDIITSLLAKLDEVLNMEAEVEKIKTDRVPESNGKTALRPFKL